jgi:hypothetical protein
MALPTCASPVSSPRARNSIHEPFHKPRPVSPSSEFVCPNRVVASPNRSTQIGHANSLIETGK